MSYSLDLSDRVALVTGGAMGIGKSIAQALAAAGARTAIHYYSSEQAANELATALAGSGAQVRLVRGDLTQPADAARVVAEVRTWAGSLDILVNNAGGINKRVPLEEVTPELLREMLDLNVLSAMLVTQAALPLLKASAHASIVNITSVAAFNGAPGACHYGAAKAALAAMTKAWAKELAPSGIRVNAVAPGVIETRFHERVSSPERMQAFRQATPLGRNASPDEVAGAVAFLASDRGSFITGETIHVNGGLLIP